MENATTTTITLTADMMEGAAPNAEVNEGGKPRSSVSFQMEDLILGNGNATYYGEAIVAMR